MIICFFYINRIGNLFNYGYGWIYIYVTQFLPSRCRINTTICYATWTLRKRLEKKQRQLHKNAASNIEQLETTPTKHQLYGHRPPITKTIQVRRTRHARHYWRNRDELISDVLLWTPTYGQAKAGRPARTYIQQLCEDTGCSPEDLPGAMNDMDKWREKVRDIRAGSTTWWSWSWSWSWYIYIIENSWRWLYI